jgi:hypothetical protein
MAWAGQERAGSPLPELAVAVSAALLVRLPTALSSVPLTYDDGVYRASAGAMRVGGLPFRDVFSSQGPAFLPLLWAADTVGLRTSWSPRLLPLAAAVVLVVVVHRFARLLSDRWGAALAALLVATSGVLVFTTGRIASDGVTAAFAATAVLVASGEVTWRRQAATAILLGLAVAVKSLFAVPAALAVAWLVLRRGGVRHVAEVAGGSLAVLVAVALPWGVPEVWDQSVGLHLRAREPFDVGASLRLLRDVLQEREQMLLWLVVAAVLAAAARRVAERRQSPPRGDRDLVTAVWVWLVAGLLVTGLHAPLLMQHVTMLVPPAAVLVARYRPPLVAVVVVLLLTVPGQSDRSRWGRAPDPPMADDAAAIGLLRSIEPRDALVISDEHALTFLAERDTPGSMVDVSFARIRSGDLTTDDVVEAASAPEVCAMVLWSGRLAALPELRRDLVEYRSVHRSGAREILLRDGCAVSP